MGQKGETRRDFFDTLLYTSLAATGLSLLAPLPFYLKPPKGLVRRVPVSAGLADSLKEGAAVNVAYGGRPAVVVRLKNQLNAFSRACTHRQTAVNWVPDKKHFACPLHGAIFDSEGNPIEGPAKTPLKKLPCRVNSQGEIIVGG